MKIRGIKKMMIAAAVLCAVLTSLSSCNRGIGCPSDFSVEQIAVPIVKGILNNH